MQFGSAGTARPKADCIAGLPSALLHWHGTAAVNSAGVLLEMNVPTLVEELSERARALSPEDRALLAEDLLESLPEESESEVEAAWKCCAASRRMNAPVPGQ